MNSPQVIGKELHRGIRNVEKQIDEASEHSRKKGKSAIYFRDKMEKVMPEINMVVDGINCYLNWKGLEENSSAKPYYEQKLQAFEWLQKK